MQKKSKPIAVIAGDIHYSLKSLEVADAATRMAISKANVLQVPFIANGDTHCTKANLRGECVNAMIETFKLADIRPVINVGNHCKIHEKSSDHSLNFLAPYADIINTPQFFNRLGAFNGKSIHIVPYHHDVYTLRAHLNTVDKGSCVILHQGLTSSNSGEYFQDHSALDPEDLANFRSILSHYHYRQDIKCGKLRKGMVGLASIIGSPYTTSFSEANDPEKGFQVLYDDGSLEFIPTNLRKHIKLCFEIDATGIFDGQGADKVKSGDLVHAVVHGPSDLLSKVTKEKLGLPQPFRLELVPTDMAVHVEQIDNKVDFDNVIDTVASIDKDRKTRLKTLWKDLVNNEDTKSKSK